MAPGGSPAVYQNGSIVPLTDNNWLAKRMRRSSLVNNRNKPGRSFEHAEALRINENFDAAKESDEVCNGTPSSN